MVSAKWLSSEEVKKLRKYCREKEELDKAMARSSGSTLDLYGPFKTPSYNEEAVKLRNTPYDSKTQESGSKMVAEEEKP